MASYVITGANRGLGFAFVDQLSTSPANTVFALVRKLSSATRLEQLHRPNVHILEADITDVQALKSAAAKVSETAGGTLDVLINNAAWVDLERSAYTLDGYPEGREDLLEADLTQAFHVNVVGVIHTTNTFLPLIRTGTAKKVITISSGRGDRDFNIKSDSPNAVPYSVSKAAVNMAMTKYAIKYKSEGIIFSSLSPGMVDTAEGPSSSEKVEKLQKMVAYFQKIKPSFRGPFTPEESARLLLGIIDELTIKDSGAAISHNGNDYDWL